MIKLLSVAIVAVLVFESYQQMPVEPTQESNEPVTEEPGAMGPKNGAPTRHISWKPDGWPCHHPTNIQCWTEWFDRDNPSGTGDWETLGSLRSANPGKICDKPTGMEVQTVNGLTVAQTGDNIFKSDTTFGFACRNRDQDKGRCHDYRVRFVCHPPFCGDRVCWTRWYDRDNPSGSGDWEKLSLLQSQNPGEICENPMYIEAVTTDTLTPATKTGETFLFNNPTDGFVCLKKEQTDRNCKDYKVRFGCPCCSQEEDTNDHWEWMLEN